MAQRSISDTEISLIKAMLVRGMKNKEIQFLFNRPDRAVNSGRITDIMNGSYSNSAEIPPATESDVNAFLKKFEPTAVSVSMAVPSGSPRVQELGPTDPARLFSMFETDARGVWRFPLGETVRHECKENFGFRHADKWLRAVSALANHEGGYILFGVKDKEIIEGKIAKDSFQVVGLSRDDFFNADPADFSKKLKSVFDPTPVIEIANIELDENKVGVIYVQSHPGRPVIATKNEGSIKEGDIFFRYPGQSARIKYSDLRSLLDERDRQAREKMLPMLSELLKLGPQNAMIANLADGRLSGEGQSILIGEELLDSINFIREGDFSEQKGAPALRLIGDVQAVDASGVAIRKGFVTPNDLIDEFLALHSPFDPKDYIRCAVEGGNGAWLPMHYYARQADMNDSELSEFIMATAAPLSRREMFRDRASGQTSAFKEAGGRAGEILRELKSGAIPEVSDVTRAADIGRAIAGLEERPTASLDDMLELLKQCKATVLQSEKASWMSVLRRGLSRLDELYFRV